MSLHPRQKLIQKELSFFLNLKPNESMKLHPHKKKLKPHNPQKLAPTNSNDSTHLLTNENESSHDIWQ